MRQAELAQNMAVAQRELLLNDLLLEAGFAYWNWFSAHNTARVYADAVDLAYARLEAVKLTTALGDRPNIDTLEASIQLQTRKLQFQEAQLAQRNATAQLSVHLWLEGEVPMTVNPLSVPPSSKLFSAIAPDSTIMVGLDEQIESHPSLGKQTIRIQSAEIDERWKREQLKPQVDLKYNALSEYLGNAEATGFNANDYALGIAIRMPIFLRKERGDLAIAALKIEEYQMGLAVKRRDLWLKTRMALNDWSLTAQQLSFFEGTTRDYESLLAAERELFTKGESSLFLVNNRESKYVNAQVKLIELIAKNKLAELKTFHSLASLNSES